MKDVALAAVVLACNIRTSAEDWPRYRGLHGTGFSGETAWVKSGQPKVAWRAEVGLGYSSVTVSNGRAYTTGHDGRGKDTLFCMDALSGKEIWRYSYPQPLGDLYFQGGTTGTPSISGGKVFQTGREGEVFCLDSTTGALVWKKHLVVDLKLEKPDWGFTGGALVKDGLLFLNAGDSGVALRVADGAPVWKSAGGVAGYSAPLPFQRGGKNLLLISDKRGYACVDADSGKEQWRQKWLTRYGVNAADPIVQGDLIFISTGYDKGALLLEWPGSGQPKALWQSREMRTQMNPCVLHEGYLYGIDGDAGNDRTGLKCLEMRSGKTLWRQEDVGHGALIAADGHLLVLTEQGELRIAPISPQGFHPSLTAKILEGRCWTQPSLSGGMLFARNQKGAVVCLDLRKSSKS